MECPNCHQPVEAGAAFCGNCGQPLTAHAHIPKTPDYAVSAPAQHVGETKTLLSLLFGIFGIAGAFFVPLAGLALGVGGLVSGTMARAVSKRRATWFGLVVSVIAVLAGLGSWAYVIKNNSDTTKINNHNAIVKNTTPAVSASRLTTPCYSTGFIDKLNVTNPTNSCDMNAFNGQTMDSSTNAYKVFANKAAVGGTNDFLTLAKQALEKDITTSLPTFAIDSESISTFASSPAYIVKTSDKAHNVAVVEAAVLHPGPTGANIFILVHATSGSSAELSTLEGQWQWKQ